MFFAGSGPMSEEHRVGEQSYSLEVDANQQDQIKATVKIGDRSISVF